MKVNFLVISILSLILANCGQNHHLTAGSTQIYSMISAISSSWVADQSNPGLFQLTFNASNIDSSDLKNGDLLNIVIPEQSINVDLIIGQDPTTLSGFQNDSGGNWQSNIAPYFESKVLDASILNSSSGQTFQINKKLIANSTGKAYDINSDADQAEDWNIHVTSKSVTGSGKSSTSSTRLGKIRVLFTFFTRASNGGSNGRVLNFPPFFFTIFPNLQINLWRSLFGTTVRDQATNVNLANPFGSGTTFTRYTIYTAVNGGRRASSETSNTGFDHYSEITLQNGKIIDVLNDEYNRVEDYTAAPHVLRNTSGDLDLFLYYQEDNPPTDIKYTDLLFTYSRAGSAAGDGSARYDNLIELQIDSVVTPTSFLSNSLSGGTGNIFFETDNPLSLSNTFVVPIYRIFRDTTSGTHSAIYNSYMYNINLF